METNAWWPCLMVGGGSVVAVTTVRKKEVVKNGRKSHCGLIWVHIFPDKSVTVRPTETCMGSGKDSPKYWVAVIIPRKILYEIGGVP
ncbi:hypothetical protein JHK86_024843 [Glycine max]|uniref:Uncharacterized protein n=1 Tax=Glycine max TaxID=3847 RepID=K7LD72_SOYBN|nr:hypothetical protein JHK86_024843 [Glycine max]